MEISKLLKFALRKNSLKCDNLFELPAFLTILGHFLNRKLITIWAQTSLYFVILFDMIKLQIPNFYSTMFVLDNDRRTVKSFIYRLPLQRDACTKN
ncbi:hypothetical protein BpHYR1_047265 [Brachionus plicatilis]|uniref:Uncharacterized protein n=1 Tax=Brachionus plicatilis TaxID=10195 RepID=A0A3M7PDL0_BRAPC|nr:hypothetical protein BpHYR1_047265 [Brachionus plicatilis]